MAGLYVVITVIVTLLGGAKRARRVLTAVWQMITIAELLGAVVDSRQDHWAPWHLPELISDR